MENWKIAFFFALGALFSMIITTALMVNLTNGDATTEGSRMVSVEQFKVDGNYCDIWVDTETRVQYLKLSTGITVMLDSDGKPILYKGE